MTTRLIQEALDAIYSKDLPTIARALNQMNEHELDTFTIELMCRKAAHARRH